MPTELRRTLVRIPVPKDHRPRPNARITSRDKDIVRDYLACKGDVASVRNANVLSQSGLLYILVKASVWKRWSQIAPPLPRCASCKRPVSRRAQAYHWDCRRKARAANTARILKRAKKLLASGLTVKATAAKVGLSAMYLSSKLPGIALTNEQRRRRGLPPAKREPHPAPSTGRRARAQRAADWVLVPVPVPSTQRGRPPRRLSALERRAVNGYLNCKGNAASVARAAAMSHQWLLNLLAHAQIWRRWKKRPRVRPTCAVCGRPVPNLRPGSRHEACWRKDLALRQKAWVTRAKALLAKGWSLQRVASDVGRSLQHVSNVLPGHARAGDIRQAEANARLRAYARHVRAGLSRREAGRRVGYAPNTVHGAAGRAKRKGYL